MKNRFRKVLAFVLILTLSITLGQIANYQSADAAKNPALNKKKVTINEVGNTYQLRVKNKPEDAKFAWSSSKESVATVTGQGLVTSKGKGTTNITCKITYPDKTSIKLTAKVTVKIAATDVQISNANKVGNAHYIEVGESFDFNRTLIPSNSSDKTYWVLKDANGQVSEEFATVNSQGVVKALKVGQDNKDVILKLEARTGANKTKAMDPLNTITDAINLVITGPTLFVTNVKQTESNVVTITFNRPILKDTVIDSKGSLTNAVKVEAKTSSNNVKANDLGTITPSLSTDGLTLTLKTQNRWSGLYYINITSAVTSTNGLSLESYSDDLDLTDNTPPTYVTTTVDGTGMLALLKFSEEIDISKLSVLGIDTAVDHYTRTVIFDLTKYKLSEDKKTLIVDLNGIISTDRNKTIAVKIAGIKDLSGNAMQPWPATVYLITDTSIQPLANLKTITRTSKYTLTAEFDKEIEYAGNLTINNFTRLGMIDANDKTKVNYTLYESELSNSTALTVTVSGWKSYRANSYASSTTRSVNMAVGLSVPQLVSSQLITNAENGVTTYQLLLTYSKNIKLVSSTGTINAVFSNANSDVIPLFNIPYTATVTADNVVNLKLDSSVYQGRGTYRFTIGEFLVYDDYMNYNAAASISVVIDASSNTPYPAPTSVTQNVNNKSQIYVNFANKVDQVSASTEQNYSIGGINPIEAIVYSNSDAGATIVLTFATGAIPFSTSYPITISNVKGHNDSYTEMESYIIYKDLIENSPPTLNNAKLSDVVSIQLNFTEDTGTLTGKPSFTVYQNGVAIPLNTSTPYVFAGNVLTINLAQPVSTSGLYVVPNANNNITDVYGNVAVIPHMVYVMN